jgi:hypothetical protein
MSKKLIALFAIVAVLSIYAVVTKADDAKGGMGSWTGEVIDVACYASKGAKGAGHMECGSSCVKSGMPVGLLVNDTTYLLIGDDHKLMNDKLAEHVSHMVTVSGTKFESAGANLILVKDFKMATTK